MRTDDEEDDMVADTGRPSAERAAMLLSTLWIFAVLNYLYCDVLGHMDAAVLQDLLAGEVDGLRLTPGFLLGAGVAMEVPIAMVLLARVLPWGANRLANILAGVFMTAIQAASLFVGTPAPYYLFFSAVELGTTLFIVGYAARHRRFA